MDMDVGNVVILGWDWISSHDLRHFHVDSHVSLWSGPERLQLASGSPARQAHPQHALCRL